MMSENLVIVAGNLTRDPDLKYTSNGIAVCSFTVAVNSTFKKKDGTTEVTYVDCVAWKGRADAIGTYLRKGNPIYVRGRLTYQTWDDKQTGAKRNKLKVTVENFQFVGSKNESGGGDEVVEAERKEKGLDIIE